MIIELTITDKEIKGNRAVTFEVYDNNGVNEGTLIIGKAGVRWRNAKGRVWEKAQSWNELISWLQQHGRTVRKTVKIR